MGELMEDQLEAWSSEGPECPNCGTILAPDDPVFYDENELWEHSCACGVTFTVQASHSVSWETVVNPKDQPND